MSRKSRKQSAGFTLIELLIVLAIIGILAAIVIPAMQTAMEKSRQRTTMANMRTIGNQLQIYHNDNSAYPDGSLTMPQLAAVVIGAPIPQQDAWKRDFDYSSDGLVAYTVESYGRDGVPGADISPSQANNFDLDIVLADGQFAAAVH